MMTVVEANQIPIIIALLIGFIIGWWIFRNRRNSLSRSAARDGAGGPDALQRGDGEGHDVADQGAAAFADVAGELLGVDAHSALPSAEGPPDTLTRLKGVGPKLAALLNDNGITRFDQLASLNGAQLARVDAALGTFKGRLERDRVVEQAGFLARGDTEGFETRFGKLGGA